MTVQKAAMQQRKQTSSVAIQRFFMKVHVFFYRLTGGLLGGKLAGRTMLLLTTTGRKSGQERVTPIFYFTDGPRFVLIGSNSGAQKHPQWWLNLQEHPQAQIQVRGRRLAVTASAASGEERQRLWSEITARYPEFNTYQQRTSREIPVVVLSPQ